MPAKGNVQCRACFKCLLWHLSVNSTIHGSTHTLLHTFPRVPPSGFYGADCALSIGARGKPELLAGQGYQPRERRPRIYVYELPPSMTNVW